VDAVLAAADGPFLLGDFSVADVIITPYIERMSASLAYYKDFQVSERNKYCERALWQLTHS
jgi:glutathione S-transferase